MDQQTIYKSAPEYYRIHSEILLKKGYSLVSENRRYGVYVKNEALPTPMAKTGGQK